MKIIAPEVKIMRTGLETDFMTPEQFIEKVGRTCYKSEDKITETSAEKFVSGLIKHGHEAMIEHWSLVFRTDYATYNNMRSDWNDLMHDKNVECATELRPFIRFTDRIDDNGNDRFIISANMRAWRDHVKACVKAMGHIPQYLHGVVNNYHLFFPEYQYYIPGIIMNDKLIPISISELTEAERKIHQDVTMKFVCDRGVTHEVVRHRVASFAQESTRYCNYAKDQFGNEITVVRPSWCDEGQMVYTVWYNGCKDCESNYFMLLSEGATPQEARSVLPSSLKAELIVTMNLDGWEHFFKLRCAPDAQPDMREVAIMAHDLFEKEVV